MMSEVARVPARGFLVSRAAFFVFAAGTALAAATLAAAVRAFGWHDGWPAMIPTREPAFLDLRSLLSALDCHRLGADVYAANDCDPDGRRFNYPRAWLRLAPTGLGEDETFPVGYAQATLFMLALGVVAARLRNVGSALIALACLVSPSVLLGIERGNIDLAMFVLLVLAALAGAAGGKVYGTAAVALFVAAAVGKLMPVFALMCVALPHRRYLRIAMAAAAASGVWFVLDPGNLMDIAANTPQHMATSYGYKTFFLAAEGFFRKFEIGGPDLHEFVRDVLPLICVAAAVALAFAWALVQRRRCAPMLDAGFDSLLFTIGGGVFAGTFLLGSNWDYRLVFLMLCLPRLFALASMTGVWTRLPARMALALLVFFLWSGAVSLRIFGLDELAVWLFWIWITGIFACSMFDRFAPHGRLRLARDREAPSV